MTHIVRGFISIGFLGLVSVLVAGVLTFNQSAQAEGKTFVYCSEASPKTFNPQLAADGVSFNASSHTVFNRLVEFKEGSSVIVPALAESWTISKDSMKYTFKLRKGVKFHSNEFFKPTRDFNADDVLYSFQVQMDPKNPLAIKNGNYEYFTSMEMDKIIKSMTKKDDYTVEMVLARQEAPFLANLAMDFASILSKEYAESLVKAGKDLETMNTNPIGTGPFVFKSYQKDTVIRFSGNENYFHGKPKIGNLIFAITPDASVRYQKLKAGECQFIAEPAPADLESIAKNSKLKLLQEPGLNIGYLAFNTEKKPYDNVKVRQAIMHALDRKSYIDAVFLGRASLAKNPMPPLIWSYNDGVKDYEYNVEKAKALLKEAGYEKGFDAEMWALPVSRPYNPSGKKMAELMQADLAKIGIRVKISTFDWPIHLEKSRKGEHQMIQAGWIGDNGDPDNFLNILLSCASVPSGTNVARWCYKPYNDLVTEAKQITNQKKRTELYKKAQVIFKDQVPWVTVAHAQVFRAMSSQVSGYSIHPFGGDLFEKVDIK